MLMGVFSKEVQICKVNVHSVMKEFTEPIYQTIIPKKPAAGGMFREQNSGTLQEDLWQAHTTTYWKN